MVVKCEIKFDNNPNGIYFAGQTLSGIVELVIDKPKNIRGLILKIEGFAKVQWSETQHRHNHGNNNGQSNHHNNNTKTIHYSGREDYLNTISYLIGSPEGNQIEIAPGTYQYNFQAVLPPMLPTSFEAKHGSIRYLINAVIDRPWKFDLTYKVAFTVIKQLDLNYENPALKIPTKMEILNTFYCGLCKTKPLFMSASIPISGYVAGQGIDISLDINNESSIAIDDLKVSLKKIIFYNSQTPVKRTKEEILSEAEIRCGGVQPKNKRKYLQKLIIPPVPPTNTNYCHVLNVLYEVHVTAKVSGMHKNPVIRLPITIGTVPLAQMQQQYQQMPLVYPSAPAQRPSPTAPFTTFDPIRQQPQLSVQPNRELPPPSYHEAIGGAVQLNEEGEHTLGSQPYNPMYPVYDFSQAAPQRSIPENGPAFGFGQTTMPASAPGNIPKY